MHPGPFTHVAVAVNEKGLVDAFVTRTDWSVWHLRQTSPDNNLDPRRIYVVDDKLDFKKPPPPPPPQRQGFVLLSDNAKHHWSSSGWGERGDDFVEVGVPDNCVYSDYEFREVTGAVSVVSEPPVGSSVLIRFRLHWWFNPGSSVSYRFLVWGRQRSGPATRELEDAIRRRAYYLWENRTGATWWDAFSNWLEAERVERGEL